MYTHPTIHQQLAQARLADLHHHAQRDALARAARQERRPRPHRPRHRLPALRIAAARQVLAALGTRSP
jgi:hypothetical protein